MVRVKGENDVIEATFYTPGGKKTYSLSYEAFIAAATAPKDEPKKKRTKRGFGR